MKKTKMYIIMLLVLIGGCTENPLKEEPKQQIIPTPKVYPLSFGSTPEGVAITILNLRGDSTVAVFSAPDTVRLPEGQYRYLAAKSGYERQTGVAPVFAGAVGVYNLTLQPSPVSQPVPTGSLTGPDTVDQGSTATYMVVSENATMAVSNTNGIVATNGSFSVILNSSRTIVVQLFGRNSVPTVIQKTTYVRNAPPPVPPTAGVLAPDEVARDSAFALTLSSSHGRTAALFGFDGSGPAPLNGQVFIRLSATATVSYVVWGDVPSPAIAFKLIRVRGTQPSPPPTASIQAPDTVDASRDFTVQLASTNGNLAVLSNYGIAPLNGSIVMQLHSSATLTYSVWGAYPSPAVASKTVYVRQTAHPVELTLAITPDTIYHGQSAVVAWNSQNADEVVISGYPGFGTMTLSGSQPIMPNSVGVITLRAEAKQNGIVRQTRTASLVVLPVPPAMVTVSISAQPDTITAGQQTTIAWASQNADRVIIDAFGEVTANGSRPDSPTATKLYRIEAWKNGLLRATDSVRVVVMSGLPPLGMPAHVSPGFGATGITTTPNFLWHAGLNTTSTDLVVRRADNGQIVLSRTAITDSLYRLVDSLNYNAQYEWALRGRRGTETTGWTTYWPFTTIAQPPPPAVGTPQFIVPAFGQNDVPVNVTFRWRRGSNAPVSWLQVRVLNSGDTLFTISTADTFYRWTSNLPAGTQMVGFLRGQNGQYYSPWSAQHPFRTAGTPPPNPYGQFFAPDSVNPGEPLTLRWFGQNAISADLSGYGPVGVNDSITFYNGITVATRYTIRWQGALGTVPYDTSRWVYVRQQVQGCYMDMNARVNGVLSVTIHRNQTARVRVYGGNLGNANCTGGGVRIAIPVNQQVLFEPINVTYSSNLIPGYGGPMWDGQKLQFNGNTIEPNESFWVEFDVVGRAEGVAEIRASAYAFEGGPWVSNPVDITVIN